MAGVISYFGLELFKPYWRLYDFCSIYVLLRSFPIRL